VRYIATEWQKHHVVESNITCLKYAHALVKANKMADSCTSNFDEYFEFCSYVRRLFSKKLHVIIKYFAVLRQSVGLLGQFATVWKNWSWHTNTTNYCNLAAHACQRLIIQWLLHIHTYVYSNYYWTHHTATLPWQQKVGLQFCVASPHCPCFGQRSTNNFTKESFSVEGIH